MIKNLTKQKQQEIVDFIKDNYEAPEYLIAQDINQLIEMYGDYDYVSTTNKKSLIMSIKRDYIIEGLMRNQDGEGTDYYVLGKEL